MHTPAADWQKVYDYADQMWIDAGQIPPSKRVIAGDQDLTELPVTEWPGFYQQQYARGWRPWLTMPDGSPPRYPSGRPK